MTPYTPDLGLSVSDVLGHPLSPFLSRTTNCQYMGTIGGTQYHLYMGTMCGTRYNAYGTDHRPPRTGNWSKFDFPEPDIPIRAGS